MRSTKFLAAMAGIAMFTACTQEDMFNANNASQQEELVGAKLVGTNLSIATDYAAGTRYAGGNTTWEEGDRVGLGWLVVGDFASPQPEQLNGMSLSNELYANHQFDYAGNHIWESKGNLYEGWYFAYYPWTYEREAAKTKKYVMNPAMKGRGAALQYSQSLYISNRQHVSAESDVDTENGSLKTPFQMNQAVKFIKVTTRPEAGSAFAATSESDLKNLEIKSISINLGEGHNYFAKEVEILAGNLPETVESIEGKTKYQVDSTNLSNFRKSLLDETNPVLRVLSNDSILTRDVTKAELLVSTNTPGSEEDVVSVYFNVLPVEDNFSLEDMTITVQAEGGASFVIKYDAKSANAAAFDAFKTAVKEGGALNTFNEPITEQKNTLTPLVLDLVLCDEDFVTDFSNISNIEEWTAAVNMVNTLQRTNEVFTIDSIIDFENSILMPTSCKITVNRAGGHAARNEQYIKLIGNHDAADFPAALTCNANIEIAEGATLNNAHLLKPLMTLHNYGTINVPAGNSVADKNILTTKKGYTIVNHKTGIINLEKLAQVSNLTNDGRVNVVYGSFVELTSADANKGIIAYAVMPADANKPARIQNVINTVSGNVNGYAQVNVLVFNSENLDKFDFTYVELGNDGEEDYYDGVVGSSKDEEFIWSGLDKVSLEINGVAVTSSCTKTEHEHQITVKNVTMTGANASLTNVNIAGDLKVTDGGEVNVNTIKGNIDSDGNVTAKSIESTTIKVGGNLTAETVKANDKVEVTGNVTVNSIEAVNLIKVTGDIKAATIKAARIEVSNVEAESIEGALFVTDGVVTAETINGDVELNGEATINNAVITGDVTVNGDATLNKVKINGTLTIVKGASVAVKGADTTVGDLAIYGNLTTEVNMYTKTVAVYKGGSANIADGMTIWYTVRNDKETGYIQQGVTDGTVKYLDVKPANADDIKNAFQLDRANISLESDVQASAAEPYFNVKAGSEIVLNGNNYNLKTGDAVNYGLIVRDGAIITINDLNVQSAGGGIGAVNGANVTFNGGSVNITSTTTSPRYNFYAEGAGTVITVNEGNFSFEQTKKRSYAYAGDGTIIYIKGGNFGVASSHKNWKQPILTSGSGQVIITGGTFGFDPSEWVADGYTATKNGATWTVSKN